LINIAKNGLRLLDAAFMCQIKYIFYESGANCTLLCKRKRPECFPEGLVRRDFGHIVLPLDN
jgi:hypothetical protein